MLALTSRHGGNLSQTPPPSGDVDAFADPGAHADFIDRWNELAEEFHQGNEYMRWHPPTAVTALRKSKGRGMFPTPKQLVKDARIFSFGGDLPAMLEKYAECCRADLRSFERKDFEGRAVELKDWVVKGKVPFWGEWLRKGQPQAPIPEQMPTHVGAGGFD